MYVLTRLLIIIRVHSSYLKKKGLLTNIPYYAGSSLTRLALAGCLDRIRFSGAPSTLALFCHRPCRFVAREQKAVPCSRGVCRLRRPGLWYVCSMMFTRQGDHLPMHFFECTPVLSSMSICPWTFGLCPAGVTASHIHDSGLKKHHYFRCCEERKKMLPTKS